MIYFKQFFGFARKTGKYEAFNRINNIINVKANKTAINEISEEIQEEMHNIDESNK